MHSGLQMMFSTQMFKDALGLTNDDQFSNVYRCTRAYKWWSVFKCLKMHSGLQMMISIQMFKDALGLTNDDQYFNV